MDILLGGIENHGTAVGVIGHSESLLSEQVHKELTAQNAQIAGDDQIIKSRSASGVLKMGGDGVGGRGGKCQGYTMLKN